MENKEEDINPKIKNNIQERFRYTIGSDFCIEQVKDVRPAKIQVLETLHRFMIASAAGICGVMVVYPIDFLKTRIQTIRKSAKKGVQQNLRYTGYLDCLVKTIKTEGFFAVYRGLTAQLIATAPEKAIKLSVQAFVRDRLILMDIFEQRIWAETIGGSCGGLCQVIASNPFEVVKIRLQMAGETGQKLRTSLVFRELGFRDLFKAVHICIFRDMMFSSIYFPLFYTFKTKFADANGYVSPISILQAATISAIPAASLSTPFDVIKTRIQAIPRPGEQSYHGFINTFSKMLKEEGPKAFFRSTLARIFRSSPQFGITLFVFEMLLRFFKVEFDNIAEKKK